MQLTILLTSTIQPSDVIFCDRNNINQRFKDYFRSFQFWIGEPSINKIVFVDNSGYGLQEFIKFSCKNRFKNKQVEILSFKQDSFDRNLGKSYGETLIIKYAIENSKIISSSDLILKGTGRYIPTNFYKVHKQLNKLSNTDVVANFYQDNLVCDSRYFLFKKDFFTKFFLPLLNKINDRDGYYFEHCLAEAVNNAKSSGLSWQPIPGGGFLVDGVQGSTNTVYPYPLHKRYLYRLIAMFRNKLPFQFSIGAPNRMNHQGSKT